MKLQKKKEKTAGYAVGVSPEIYKALENVRANMEGKMSLQALATELLREAIANIEWVDEKEEEKDVPIDKLMRERI